VLVAARDAAETRLRSLTQMLVNAVDISPLCFHMTCLQTTLRRIPALVEMGDTLRHTRIEST
jgi:hypothetical protein